MITSEDFELTNEMLKQLESRTNDKFAKFLIQDLKKDFNNRNRNKFFEFLSYDRVLKIIDRENNRKILQDFKKARFKDKAFKLKATLRGKKREFLINGEFTLDEFSRMIQNDFDMEPMHLYEFKIGKYKYGPETDEWKEYIDALDDIKIGAAISAGGLKIGDKFSFLYDSGNRYKFAIEVQDIIKLDLSFLKNGKRRAKTS